MFPSPLQGVLWWRICLDEAQKVENTATGAAEMALRLSAVNRWCVTGTPIGRGRLEDLYELVLFLGIAPFDDKRWWRSTIQEPFMRGQLCAEHRLRELFGGVLCRRRQELVVDQMNIPEQQVIDYYNQHP